MLIKRMLNKRKYKVENLYFAYYYKDNNDMEGSMFEKREGGIFYNIFTKSTINQTELLMSKPIKTYVILNKDFITLRQARKVCDWFWCYYHHDVKRNDYPNGFKPEEFKL